MVLLPDINEEDNRSVRIRGCKRVEFEPSTILIKIDSITILIKIDLVPY